MHFLRAVEFAAAARAGNHVEIGRNVLTDGRTRQQAVQRRNVRQLGHDFFNAGNRDMHGRHGGAQAAVALVFDQAQRSRFGDGEIDAAQADICRAVYVAQGLAGEAGQSVYVVGQRCAEVLVEQFADLFFGFMNRGHHDVGGFFTRHLNDEFAQIAFYRFHAVVGQIMVQLDFLADHGFAFDHQFAVVRADDAVNDFAGFGRRFRPVYFHAQTGQVFFQLLQ